MFNTTAMAVALAAALIGSSSLAQAANDNSGEYKGGALYGPMPGQIFGLGQGGAAYGMYGGRNAYGYAGPRGAYAYAGPRGMVDPTEGPNSAGHYRYHWEEYLTPE